MHYGIPKYRLPRDILDAEISRILDMGITLELDATVTDIQAELEAGYDAAFVAAGAHIGRRAYIPAGDSARIIDAVSVLHGMEDGASPMLGRRVAVYGGGNTAVDAARAEAGKLVIEKMKLDETGFRQPTGSSKSSRRTAWCWT